MKKIVLSVALLCSIFVIGQVKEPEFTGDVNVITNNSEFIVLERESASMSTKMDMGLAMLGVVSMKTKLVIPNASSKNKLSPGNVEFIIKVKDNDQSPQDLIGVIKLEETGSKRKSELSSIGTFSGVTNGKEIKVPFKGEKFGENSYKITLDNVKKGEYCVIFGDKELQKLTSVSLATFSVN